MKKTLRKRLGELVFLLFFNFPYFIFLWLILEDVVKINKTGALALTTLIYLEYCIAEHKRDELEERIKDLEKKFE